jgi:serine protease AprX
MNKQLSKLVLVAGVLLALYLVTLPVALPADAQNSLQTAKIEPALLKAMQANPRGEFAVIVQSKMPNLNLQSTADPKGLPSLRDIRNANGVFDLKQALKKLAAQRADWVKQRVVSFAGKRLNNLAFIGGVAATLNYNAIANLSRDAFVSYIHLDKKIKPLGTPGELSLYAQIVHATDVWAQGFSGQGIAVAIVDSGIAPVDDLSLPSSRIVASVDLTSAPASGDPGGHGTHVAGIVAGNGTDSAQSRQGVAPGAKVVNVRVIGAEGVASLSSVIRGIEWVINNRKTYNIRVMNLSLGATATTGYRDDPLAAAVEMAWNSGIVVVAAAGNAGPLPASIVTPGTDPFVITAGALDDATTLSTADDTVAFFSSLGPTFSDGLNKPDLVAPRRKVVALRAMGSYLDNLLPERRTDTYYFRLSGTSMSAPVVAGSVALMLQKNPSLKPTQVEYILTHTTQPVVLSPGANVTGAGLLNAYAAVNSTLNSRANLGLTPSDNFAKSVYSLVRGMPLAGKWRNPTYRGINWSDITWDDITWDRTTWENLLWEDITWDNITWTDITWEDITWDAIMWDVSAVPGYNESGTWEAMRTLD